MFPADAGGSAAPASAVSPAVKPAPQAPSSAAESQVLLLATSLRRDESRI